MKKYAKFAVVLCLAALSAATGIAAYKCGGEIEPEEETVAAMSYSEPAKNEYCLRECEGYIAVYRVDDLAEPMTVTDIEVSTLNDNDRLMLQNGITAENKTELISLLEDLSS